MPRNMKNGAAKISALVAELDSEAQEALATFLEAAVASQNANSLEDLAGDVKPRRRGSKATTKTSRRAAKDDDEDELEDLDDEDEDEDEDDKPARGKRRAKKAPAKEKPTRRSRKAAEPDEDDEDEETDLTEATLDAIEAFLTDNAFEPVAGGVRELKPLVESWGGDFDAVTAGAADRREKAEQAGVFVASMKAALAKLKKIDEDDVNALAEELGLEPGRNVGATAKAILISINSEETDADEDEDDDGDED